MLKVIIILVHFAASGWQYGDDCCGRSDCYQMAEPPMASSNGWVVGQETIPFDDPRVRRSGDQFFHRCSNSAWTRCLYVPQDET